jgi:hypothetical protein
MRSLPAIISITLISSGAWAETVDYNDPINQQERYIPNRQYINTQKSPLNGKKSDTELAYKGKTANFKNRDHELEVGLETGYRTSELKWNIAGDLAGDGVSAPNVLSEVKWKSVNGYEFKPNVEYTQKTGSLKGLHLEASANKSITVSGKDQDSDYNGNNRTLEYSRSIASSDDGHAEGFSASIGYAFDFNNDRRKTLARFTALVGYAMQSQKFVSQDGVQVIPAFGPFDGLNSSYNVDWNAPFIGAQLTGFLGDTQHIKILANYYRGNYEGTGNWNLRPDFAHPVSFRDKANGYGFLVGAEYGWEFYPHLQATLSTTFNYMKVDDGKSTTYFSDGTSSLIKFNEAEWISQNYMVGLNYTF